MVEAAEMVQSCETITNNNQRKDQVIKEFRGMVERCNYTLKVMQRANINKFNNGGYGEHASRSDQIGD